MNGTVVPDGAERGDCNGAVTPPSATSHRLSMPDTLTVSHDPAAHRFEVRTEVGTGLLTYHDRGSVLEILHTEVPAAAEGHGYAAALAVAALDFARSEGKRVIPSCPFVAAYIRRHPGYADLVAP